jgi:Icc-related predicted phosphoesterase
MKDIDKTAVQADKAAGMSYRDIAKKYKLSFTAIKKILDKPVVVLSRNDIAKAIEVCNEAAVEIIPITAVDIIPITNEIRRMDLRPGKINTVRASNEADLLTKYNTWVKTYKNPLGPV